MKTFEVELRALLTKEKYDELVTRFNKQAKGIVDDADTYTFLTPKYNIKIKNRTTLGKAKITVKKGAEYQQQVDEYELPINPQDIDRAVALITALGFEKHIPSKQRRIDYAVDGMVISLKHETNWGYHIEAEIIVESEKDIAAAKQKLHTFFTDLAITPMTEQEMRKLINTILQKYDIDSI